MAIMLIATVPGGTREQQQQMVDHLQGQLKRQPGFLIHAGGPTDDGWRLYEVWETREQLQTWLDTFIFPNLPPDAPQPDMQIVPVDIIIRP